MQLVMKQSNNNNKSCFKVKYEKKFNLIKCRSQNRKKIIKRIKSKMISKLMKKLIIKINKTTSKQLAKKMINNKYYKYQITNK